jgi:hypothetical protein
MGKAHMWRGVFLVAVGIAASGAANAPTTMHELTFLTRDDCVNTPDMVNNLDDALKALGWPKDYQYVNIGKRSSVPCCNSREAHPRHARR